MNPGWSYILTAIGVFGLWLAGRKDWRGWLVGLSAQGVWLAYAAMGVHRVGLRLRVGVRAQHLAHAASAQGADRMTTPTLALLAAARSWRSKYRPSWPR